MASPLNNNDNNLYQSFVSSPSLNQYNLSARSFIPFHHPVYSDTVKEAMLEDDDILNINEHLMNSHLLEEEEEQEAVTDDKQSIWTQQWNIPKDNNSVKDIWKDNSHYWDTFHPYSRGEDEQDFDPTLQFYRGELYDAETIEDMNKLSLEITNPSLEETEAENVGEDMSTLQMMQTIFSDLSDEQLNEALDKHDYDVDRAIESLLNNTQVNPLQSTTKKRQVCRHFLAGECYRKDCWFVHDLQEKVCKFWLQGSCLKGDLCEFSHGIDIQEVASKINLPHVHKKPESVIQFNEGDYPELSHTKTQKIQPKQGTVEEEFPSLAAAAQMKKKPVKTGPINFAEAAKKKGQPVNNKRPQKSKLHNHSHSNISLHQLKQPIQIPWLEAGSALNSLYMKEREQAIEYGMLRNRFFSKATEYYLKGDGAKAKAYSMEAKHYNKLMQEMHKEASQRIFEQRSQNEAFIDLHGLHEDEALDIIERRLMNLKSYSGVIYIVTGTGHHSGASGLSKRQSKLKPAVENYLRQGNYRFAETSVMGDTRGGVFAVDLSRH
ncbi:hypothetical protein BDB01DRAFT_782014 [Pilobolus umbonatus]|nr:hypothetical protein BDB01DRAFT_782014 [Pilobolus umbonatus]